MQSLIYQTLNCLFRVISCKSFYSFLICNHLAEFYHPISVFIWHMPTHFWILHCFLFENCRFFGHTNSPTPTVIEGTLAFGEVVSTRLNTKTPKVLLLQLLQEISYKESENSRLKIYAPFIVVKLVGSCLMVRHHT